MQLITARSLNDIYSDRLDNLDEFDLRILRINATHGNYMTLLLYVQGRIINM